MQSTWHRKLIENHHDQSINDLRAKCIMDFYCCNNAVKNRNYLKYLENKNI